MGQRSTRGCQRVKIWRRNRRRSQRTNRIVPMVIGNEKKEVRWHYRLIVSIAVGASVEAAGTCAVSSWGDSHEIRMMAVRTGGSAISFMV